MGHLEEQCTLMLNILYAYYDKHVSDRVSDADDNKQAICINTKQQNENRDTNFIDKIDKIQTQARDQLTIDTPHNVAPYSTW